MEGAGIRDGDLAVLEKKEPKAGDVVAALMDGEVTLKRLVTERRGWFLKSENPDFPDLTPRRNLEVQGCWWGWSGGGKTEQLLGKFWPTRGSRGHDQGCVISRGFSRPVGCIWATTSA